MKITDIRPIPKRILTLIKKTDEQDYPRPDGHIRFYAYLTTVRRELAKITVAVKHYRRKWYCKQVAVHGVYSSKCYVKDMEYCGFCGMGFRIGWYDEGIQPEKKWFERGWCYAADKYYDPSCPTVNLHFIGTLPEYRYSAYELYGGGNILRYLRLYNEYPQIEYLMKLGFYNIALHRTILQRCGKDKNFCKWLIKNRKELTESYHYVSVIMRAYKTGRPLAELQGYQAAKYSLRHSSQYDIIRETFKGERLEKFFAYIAKQNATIPSYIDYLKACKHLGLDLSLERNLLPRDFKRWHDIRIDEYNTAKAVEDQQKRKELYDRFAEIADKYTCLQHNKRSAFVAIIAKSPAELVTEGDALHHCVGRFNYDQKFVREETLIFFIRAKECPDTPFVTVEYSPSRKTILQCYGDHDSKPDDSVLHYVNKVWLPHANRTLTKMAA